MKTLPEYETTVQMPDGETVPVYVGIKNRQITVRPKEPEERFKYLLHMPFVMDQLKLNVALRVGHTGENTTIEVVAPNAAL